MKKRPVYKATARLSSAQKYTLACLVREKRVPAGSKRSIGCLETLGLVEFAPVNLGDGVIGGEWRATAIGIARVRNDNLYPGLSRLEAPCAG